MSTRMTKDERETFLADTHIGVLSVTGDDGAAPMAAPIWYGYEPGGELRFATGPETRKMALIRSAGRVTFTVQQEAMPYKYVTVEGPVLGEEPVDMDEYLRWTVRYMGTEAGERFFYSAEDSIRSMRTIRVRPERWLTFDWGKEYKG
ncbi:pyridoxamine 5'-phosphate oxidase family protein [Nonomuraea sp. NPDC050790]|uniref:pyridoxamine 5'-phosphate oxidase family protein n=1 Tax=Nonomuraea sp. NPDC050790 TaxID=3364371 RepID=UPI0037B8D538